MVSIYFSSSLSHSHYAIHCHCPPVCLSFLSRFLLFLFLSLSICFSFSLSLAHFSGFLSFFFSCLFPFYISFLYFSFCLSFIHFSLSFYFLSFPSLLSVSICLSLSLSFSMSPFVNVFPIPFHCLNVSEVLIMSCLCDDNCLTLNLSHGCCWFSLYTHNVFSLNCFLPSLWGIGIPIAECKNQRSWSNTRYISHRMCKEYTILLLRIGTLLPECKNQCWCMSTGHT